MQNYRYYRRKILTWLLPYTCLLCGKHSTRDQDLCEACFKDLPTITTACPCCGKPSPHHITLCLDCLKLAPPFDRTCVLYYYEAPITRLIMNLKFGHGLVNARLLGELLTEKIREVWYKNIPLPQVIIPVPLHYQRVKERGFNQAIEIARPIAKDLAIPLDYFHCQRIKNTAAQATLPASGRLQNMKNAFYIMPSLPYRHIAVLDDVITTGRTMNEFCTTLKRAGVAKIDVWCCARPDY